jgi:hypothetical protein
MNILDVLRTRILEEFPDITDEELTLRIAIAHRLLERV